MAKNEKMINWLSTILGIVLAFAAVVGWVKESGKNDAISDSIAVQTQKQWELRAEDQKRMQKMELDIAKLQTDMEWLRRAHKIVECDDKR